MAKKSYNKVKNTAYSKYPIDYDLINLINEYALGGSIGSMISPMSAPGLTGGSIDNIGGLKGNSTMINNFTPKAGFSLSNIGGGALNAGASMLSSLMNPSGNTTGVGNALQSIGGLASNIPGIGGVIGAGTNLVGGIVNTLFGSNLNEEFINKTESDISDLRATPIDASTTDSVLAQQGNIRSLGEVSKKDVGTDGAFSSKAKRKTRALNNKIGLANTALNMNFAQAFGNANELEDLNLMGNYSAYGGPIMYKDGGGIHIKKANRGKFTEYCGGKVTSACIKKGKNSSSPAVRKRATFADNARSWNHAFGGWLNTQGGDFSTGVTFIDEGGTHEENPNDGVLMGVDPNGIPNLVEEGEVLYNDYVFSDRLEVPNEVKKQLKTRGNTFAKAAKALHKESEERPNDPISKRGLNTGLDRLSQAQEEVREKEEAYREGNEYPSIFAKGGYMGNEFAGEGDRPQVMSRSAAKRLGYPVDNKTYTDILAESFDEDDDKKKKKSKRATWMRYAPIAGAGIATLTDLFNRPDYSSIDRIADIDLSPSSVSPSSVGNYLSYNPLDRNFYTNKLDANNAATRRGIVGTSGGNRATAMAGLLSADYNYNLGLGELARKSEEYNQAQKERVEGFNRGTNMYNSDSAMRAEMFNAESRNASQRAKLGQAQTVAQLREGIKDKTEGRRSANISNFLQGLGDMGWENFNANMINSNPALYYTLDSSGEVGYKRNKKKKGGRIVR